MGSPSAAAAAATDVPTVAVTESEARVLARRSGREVEVEAFRSETSEVFVNPDGSLSQVQHTNPVRTRQNGKWVKVDPTLIVDELGRIRPKATTLDMTLSGGGHEPLAILKNAGKSMTLGWKRELPRPTLEGDTATYAEVLPGVDLQARSTVDGFSHVLVVKTREAAANPALATLRYSLQAPGISVKDTDGSDQIRFVDQASGGTVFEAPTPTMWDSSTSETIAQAAEQAQANPLSRSATSTESLEAGTATSIDDPADAQAELIASAMGPGETSKVADLPMSVQDNQMALVPDQTLLAAADTQYPVYIDPVFGSTKATKWAVTNDAYPDATYPQFRGWANQGVGLCAGDMPKCAYTDQTRRMHFLFPMSAYLGKRVLSAQLQVFNSYSTECEPDRFVDVWWTNTFDASLTWKKQNVSGWWKQLMDTQGSAYGGGKKCPGKTMEFDVTAGVKGAVTAKLPSMGIGLRAHNENNIMAHKWFSDDAYLRINYNSSPNQPDQKQLSMTPGGACVYPATTISSATPQLSAVLTDPDGAVDQIRAEFGVAWDAGDGGGNKTRWTSGYTKPAASGSVFRVTIPAAVALPKNTVISWYVTAYDALDASPPSYDGDKQTSCYFIVDTTIPVAPTVTSSDYPAINPDNAEDPNNQPHGGVGKPGTFTIQPASASNAAKYWVTVNVDPTANDSYPAPTGDGPLTLSLTPTQVGPNVVRVKAISAAGVGSEISEYMFNVGPGSAAVAQWKMDETSGSQLADAAGAFPATVKGGATLGQPGVDGQALTLNGTDGHAVFNGSVVDATKSFTVAGWAKLDTLTQHGVMISGQGNRVIGWRIGFRYDTKQWFMSMTSSDTDAPTYPEIRSTGPAQAGVWTHVAGVYDATAKKMRLYVNGIKQNEISQTSTWSPALATVIGNGKWRGGIYDWWRGQLDDIRAYNRVVSDEEMGQLANTTPVLTGRWKLNTATDTTPKTSPDDSTNARHLQLGDTAAITPSDPIVGTGSLILNGSANSWAATSTPPVTTAGNFTLAGWASIPANPTTDMTVFSTDGATNGAFALRYIKPAAGATGTWRADMYDKDATGSIVKSAVHTGYQPGQPQHLAITYDAGTSRLSLYVDGRLDQPNGTCSGSVNCAAPTFTTTRGLQLGRSKNAGQWGQYFSGAIDDLWTYQTTSSAKQIQQLGNPTERGTYPPAPKKAWLEFNETDGTTAADSSCNDNAATLMGGVTWLQENAAVGTAITLNGTDGYAQTQGPVVDTNASFTVAAWAKLSTDGKTATLISQDGTRRSGMLLQYSEPAKKWAFTLPTADTDNAATGQVLSLEPAKLNEWVHLTGIYDATNRKIILYVNAQPQGSTTVSPAWKASGPLAVGRGQLNAAPADFWPGGIDEPQVYQGIVEEANIQRLYAEGGEAANP